MAATRVRSDTAHAAASDAFRFPPRVPVSELLREPLTPPAPRRAQRRSRSRIAWVHIALELILGIALASLPLLLGMPLGAGVLAVPMGVAIAVTAVKTPPSALPLRGQRLYDRAGIDILLLGFAALLWLAGEHGATAFFGAVVGAHVALIALTRRLAWQRLSPLR